MWLGDLVDVCQQPHFSTVVGPYEFRKSNLKHSGGGAFTVNRDTCAMRAVHTTEATHLQCTVSAETFGRIPREQSADDGRRRRRYVLRDYEGCASQSLEQLLPVLRIPGR